MYRNVIKNFRFIEKNQSELGQPQRVYNTQDRVYFRKKGQVPMLQ